MKFETNITKEIEIATCRTNNAWDEPSPWTQCVESKCTPDFQTNKIFN